MKPIPIPAILLLLMVAAPFPGCHSPDASVEETVEEQDVELVGTSWLLESLAGGAVLADVRTTVTFEPEGRIGGQGGCNSYFASVQLDGERISVGPIGATRMACPPAIMEQEMRYFALLGEARRLERDGATLVIHCDGSGEPLRFTRVEG
jgi:heat shock protein HslJ